MDGCSPSSGGLIFVVLLVLLYMDMVIFRMPGLRSKLSKCLDMVMESLKLV